VAGQRGGRRVVQVRLQPVMIRRPADTILAAQTRVPGRADDGRRRGTQRTECSNGPAQDSERNRGQVPPAPLWALEGAQRSVPAPAVATASSGWISTTRATPARHTAPATMRDRTGVAPSVNGTASPASA
jgi:hypothetical protein